MYNKSRVMPLVLSILSIIFMLPIYFVFLNSFKTNLGISNNFFNFITKDNFNYLNNYITALTFGQYPFFQAFLNSAEVTIVSSALIVVSSSMASWYIVRVKDFLSKITYMIALFSMVVPFQMIMFTLSKTADMFNLTNPLSICIVYLGVSSGMAIFMFCASIKSIPQEIEEAALIDGCSPLQSFFLVVFPLMKSTVISVSILEVMWIWNDYLLPYLILDRTKFMTIPVYIQYLQGGYGKVDLGVMMALVVMCLIPIVFIYIKWQKYIIQGITEGSVK